jgi:signal transduction histidine kinase
MDSALAQLILQDQKIAYAVVDRDLNVVETDGAADVLHIGLEGGRKCSLFDLVPELAGAETTLSGVMAGESPSLHLERVNRPAADGGTRYVTLSILPCPERHQDGALLVVAADASEEGRYIQTLTQQRNELGLLAHTIASERSRLLALIESNRDGILLVGAKLRVLLANAPALEFLGLAGSAEDWTDRPIEDMLSTLEQHAPDAARKALAEIERVRAGDESPGEGEVDIPPRTIHWLDLPVATDGTPLGRLLVLRDVTEERMVEKMRDDLSRTMVHDLRNPLTAISVSLQLLDMEVEENASSDARLALESAHNGARRMLKLVNNILDVSRLESRQMPLKREAVSLSNLVAETLQAQSPLAADRGLRLESDAPLNLPPAWADAGLIERVLQNLVDNAIKFTPAGGLVKVAVGLAAADGDESPSLLVSVADSGPGIPPELQSRLFQKFVTGKLLQRGSGLGLAFCKLVVEAHDGRIWVESKPGKGATFCFTLPLSEGGA